MVKMIRVGSIVDGKHPSYGGFKPIVCMTKSSAYGAIGPYCLVTDEGAIFENLWQFSKCYEQVPQSVQRYSRWDNTIIWNHPTETHMKDGKLLPAYWEWRKKGMANVYPVRYPVGTNNTNSCVGCIMENGRNLGYVEARKELYLREFCRLVKQQPKFQTLKKLLAKGVNLLIIEVDGPRQRSSEYYTETYGTPDDWIENETISVTEDNMKILINDTRERFGHGYCLAIALLDMENRF